MKIFLSLILSLSFTLFLKSQILPTDQWTYIEIDSTRDIFINETD